MTRRRFLSWITLGAATGALAACGRKAAPEWPEGRTYPQRYPYVPPAETKAADDKATTEEKPSETGRQSLDTLRLDPISRP